MSSRAVEPRAAQARELKKYLHRLYQRVHPDRLGQFPEHRATNEKSFQDLQAALDRYHGEIQPVRPPSGAPSALTFFVHAASRTADEPLQKASVALHNGNLAQALHELFQLVGLEPPPQSVLPRVQGAENDAGAGNAPAFETLTALVKHARHAQMAAMRRRHDESMAAAESAMDDEALVTRLALQRSRGVTVRLGGGLPQGHKLTLLFRRLAEQVAAASDVNMHSLVIEMDGGFDVSLNTQHMHPTLHLGACAPSSVWGGVLSSDGLAAACTASRAASAKLRELESRTANALGVKLVLYDAATSPPDAYVTLLDSLMSLGDSVYTQHVESIAIMLTPGTTASSDAIQGVLRTGVAMGPTSVLDYVRAHGPATNHAHVGLTTARTQETRRVHAITRSLRLANLRRGEDVSDRQWNRALDALRADRARLAAVLDGVAVVVGTRARVLDTGEVEIPADFYKSVSL